MRLGIFETILQLISSYNLSFYATFRTNKTYSEEEIKDMIFELFLGAIGIELSRDFKDKKKESLVEVV